MGIRWVIRAQFAGHFQVAYISHESECFVREPPVIPKGVLYERSIFIEVCFRVVVFDVVFRACSRTGSGRTVEDTGGRQYAENGTRNCLVNGSAVDRY